MRKILAILFVMILVLAGCGEDPTRGYSTDPDEFPTDLQALESGATIEEASALTDVSEEIEVENGGDIASFESADGTTDDEEAITSDNEQETVDDTNAQADSSEEVGAVEDSVVTITLVLNTNSMKAHLPECSSVDDMKPANRLDFTGTVEEVTEMGYVACQRCHPF